VVHTCGSEDCSRPVLEPGDEVVQLLRTTCYEGFVSLTFAALLAEWHRGCFREPELNPQQPPYLCQSCGREIADGQEVSFFVIGKETDRNHSVSETRDEEICSVRHVKCPR
jgi:hypothetical protein